MQINVDYYHVLGVPKSAGTDELRQAHNTLSQQYHPDTNPEAQEKFNAVQKAYQVLADRAQRYKYLRARAMQGLDQPVAINVYPVGSHNLLPAASTPQAYYVLLKISPAANLSATRMPLNLCLVLDRSTSMQGGRLHHVKEATNQIIDRLQPQDTFSLVTFSDRAEVLVPSQTNINKARAKAVVSTIQPGGGTEILRGLTDGLEQITRRQSAASINQLILLTDGQTYGDEQQCLDLAKLAGNYQINITTLGIGTDWNEELLDQMAAYSGGAPIYVDSPYKVQIIFNELLHNLEQIAARELSLAMNLHPKVQLHDAYQITPYIRNLRIAKNRATLGLLPTQSSRLVLLEFRLQDMPLGKQRLAHFKVEADIPEQSAWRTWETADINVHIDSQTLAGNNVPKTITNVLEKIAVFRMYQKLMDDFEAGDLDKAIQRVKVLATRLLNIGESDLAQLAMMEVGQIAKTRHLSAKGRKQIRYGIRTLSTRHKMALPVSRGHTALMKDAVVIPKPKSRG